MTEKDVIKQIVKSTGRIPSSSEIEEMRKFTMILSDAMDGFEKTIKIQTILLEQFRTICNATKQFPDNIDIESLNNLISNNVNIIMECVLFLGNTDIDNTILQNKKVIDILKKEGCL